MDDILLKIENMNKTLQLMDIELLELSTSLIGRKVKIMSTAWNGQANGFSKPKLYGKIFTVTSVSISNKGHGNEIIIFTGGDRCSIGLSEVQVLDDDYED